MSYVIIVLRKSHESFMKPPVPEDMSYLYCVFPALCWGHTGFTCGFLACCWGFKCSIASGAPVITAGCCQFFFVYTAGTFKRMCCYFHLVSRSVWRSARSAAAIISIGLTPRASWVSSICCSGPRASQIPHQNTARCQLKTDRLLSACVRWTQSKRPR